ncbi:pathogenicity island protein [Aeribacillus composti]|uniref:pathogenicity island protein n=1 Tax=Aeribacillus composti TaxID=1868734 RepID=UPI00399C711A
MAHGQFGKWLESVGMNHRVANQMMKVAAELDDEKWRTSSNLGMEALYQIATMPEEQRYRPHTIPSTGEVKTVDEMTVRELPPKCFMISRIKTPQGKRVRFFHSPPF